MLLIVGFCVVTMRAAKKYNNASIKEANGKEHGKLSKFHPSYQSITGPNTLKGVESDQSTSKSMTWSVNEALVTEIEPR